MVALKEVLGLAIVLVLIAIVMGIGAYVNNQFAQQICIDYNETSGACEDSGDTLTAYNVSIAGVDNISDLNDWVPILVIIAIAGIAISGIVGALAFRKSSAY